MAELLTTAHLALLLLTLAGQYQIIRAVYAAHDTRKAARPR